MLVIFSPELDFMNSLLMKIPVGSLIFLPLGALRSIDRSDILEAAEWKARFVGSEMKSLCGTGGCAVLKCHPDSLNMKRTRVGEAWNDGEEMFTSSSRKQWSFSSFSCHSLKSAS
jgi:hypothetical protein